MRLFNEQEINWQAYQMGFDACQGNRKGNPFDIETNDWYSWNKGWNANLNVL